MTVIIGLLKSMRSLNAAYGLQFWSRLGHPLTLVLGFILVLSGCATQTQQPVAAPEIDEQNTAEHYVELGVSYLQRHAKTAAEYFDKAIELCKNQNGHFENVYATRSLPETFFYTSKASIEGKDAIAISAVCADAFYLKGYAALDLGEVEQAQALVEQAVSLSPVNAMYLSELGHIYHVKRDWEKALVIFSKAETAARHFSPDELRASELTRALRGGGYSLIELGRLDEAESKYYECLEIDKNDEISQRQLAYIKAVRSE